MTATGSTVNDCNLRQLEKWAIADVCALTFWTCPASVVSQQNLQRHWWMTRKQLLFPASVNRNILIHEVMLQAVGYKQCKQFIVLHRCCTVLPASSKPAAALSCSNHQSQFHKQYTLMWYLRLTCSIILDIKHFHQVSSISLFLVWMQQMSMPKTFAA